MHYPRRLAAPLKAALQDTRVVFVAGPRQAGKTTLVHTLEPAKRQYISLDNAVQRHAAQTDPVGFIKRCKRVTLDEIQRAPQLLLAIKESVDRDPQPGRFLLTGSADIFALPQVADSLAGRIEILQLLPLTQSEIKQQPSHFLERLWQDALIRPKAADMRQDIMQLVLRGGFPEVLARPSYPRQRQWFRSYIRTLLQRDRQDIAQVLQVDALQPLLQTLACTSGNLLNATAIGGALGLNHVTTQRYIGIFKSMFLLVLLPPWHSNKFKRLSKSPKLHFLDSGLLATLQGVAAPALQTNRQAFGPILESFVAAELLKLISFADEAFQLYHLRDGDNFEVDFILENARGDLVGIEVKATASVTEKDFRGLQHVAAKYGQRFKMGLILCDHNDITAFGPRLYAAPLALLWT